jgi:hypothetical protein
VVAEGGEGAVLVLCPDRRRRGAAEFIIGCHPPSPASVRAEQLIG